MKLRRLEIHNFRAFTHAVMEFPESGVLLIAGANNAGKSALLSALDIVAFGDSLPEVQHHGSTEPAAMTATFALDDDERRSLLRGVSDTSLLDSDAFREVRWQFEDIGINSALVPIRITTTWQSHGDVVLADYSMRNNQPTIRRTGAMVILAGQPESNATFALESSSVVPLHASGLRGQAPNLGVLAPLVNYLESWAAGLYHFKALRPGTTGDTHQISGAGRLEPTGQNLPAVLNHLYHNQRQTYETLNQLLQQIVPGIGQLELPLDGNQTRITFRDPNAPTHVLNLKSLGTGVEQLLMTLVVGLMGDGPSGVIVEEPETNLHPGAQRALLTLIREWSKARLYIMATHSPVLLDTTQPAEVVLVTRQSGASTVRSLGGDALEALDELGVRLSDVLSADRLLLIEGKTDEAILRVWFPEYLSHPRIAVVQGIGGDNARYARHLQSWLAQADRLGDRRVLYIRDRDELPEAEVKSLEQGDYVRVPLRREIENYLLDGDALTAIIRKRQKDRIIESDEVAKVMRQVADELQPTVVLKRVCRSLAPIRLMDNDLRGKLATEKAGLAELQLAVSERAKSPDEVKATVAALWPTIETEVMTAWEQNWMALAPGEEILKGIWHHFGLDGYSKASDGPKIAAAMAAPPQELREILAKFIETRARQSEALTPPRS